MFSSYECILYVGCDMVIWRFSRSGGCPSSFCVWAGIYVGFS